MRFTHTLFRSKADAQGRVVEKAAGFLVRPEQDLDALAQLCIFPAGALDAGGPLVRRLLQRGLENSLFAVVLLFHKMECYCILYHKAKSGKKKHAPPACPTGSYCAEAVFFPASALSNSASFIFQSAALSDWPVAS